MSLAGRQGFVVSTPKTRLEREFDPQVVRDLKARWEPAPET
jgi:hypothetical protein